MHNHDIRGHSSRLMMLTSALIARWKPYEFVSWLIAARRNLTKQKLLANPISQINSISSCSEIVWKFRKLSHISAPPHHTSIFVPSCCLNKNLLEMQSLKAGSKPPCQPARTVDCPDHVIGVTQLAWYLNGRISAFLPFFLNPHKLRFLTQKTSIFISSQNPFSCNSSN